MKHLWRIVLVSLIFITIAACTEAQKEPAVSTNKGEFSTKMLTIDDTGINKLRGQVLYMPIYSNIPCKDHELFDLSGFIAIHNTDLTYRIRLARVLYFDNDGKLVKDFLKQPMILSPLAATNFFIPKTDRSGTGANFLIEWLSDAPVTEPLIESIMISCQTNYGISFLSKGRVIRELK